MNNDIKFLNTEQRTRYSLTNFEDHFGLHASFIFRPQCVWFLVHLYVGLISNSRGQLAEIIIYIIPLEYICIVTRSYWPKIFADGSLERILLKKKNRYNLDENSTEICSQMI